MRAAAGADATATLSMATLADVRQPLADAATAGLSSRPTHRGSRLTSPRARSHSTSSRRALISPSTTVSLSGRGQPARFCATRRSCPVASPALLQIGSGLPARRNYPANRSCIWRRVHACGASGSNTATSMPIRLTVATGFDQFSMIIEAATMAMGFALLPLYLIEQELNSGKLRSCSTGRCRPRTAIMW